MTPPVPAHSWLLSTLLEGVGIAFDRGQWARVAAIAVILGAGSYGFGFIVGVTLHRLGFIDLIVLLTYPLGVNIGVMLQGLAVGLRPATDHE